MIRVTAVQPNSIAAELGLIPGTELLTVNGRELDDFLDWEFLTAEETFLLHVRQPGGEEIEFDLERPLDEPLGVSLEPARIRRCANRCDFCFVDGLPDGLRDVLYIRDDDYRLSFRYGNFATLTNLKPQRCRADHRVPAVSACTSRSTPPIRLLADICFEIPLLQTSCSSWPALPSTASSFIPRSSCRPGVNDGPVLRQTPLRSVPLGPAILGCSVVPVGLTEYSKHHLVREPTAEECRAAIGLIEERATVARARTGTYWAFGADELYLRAGVELPPAEIYDGFDQVENGVGSVRWLQQRIDAVSGRAEGGREAGSAVVTGTAMSQLMPKVLAPLAQITGSSTS